MMKIKIINKNKIKAYKKPIIFHRLLLCGGGLPFMVGFFVCLFFACPVAFCENAGEIRLLNQTVGDI